jgi:hypothetical protein
MQGFHWIETVDATVVGTIILLIALIISLLLRFLLCCGLSVAKIGQSAPFHTPWLGRERPNLCHVSKLWQRGQASGVASLVLAVSASITCGNRARDPAMGVEMCLSSN